MPSYVMYDNEVNAQNIAFARKLCTTMTSDRVGHVAVSQRPEFKARAAFKLPKQRIKGNNY